MRIEKLNQNNAERHKCVYSITRQRTKRKAVRSGVLRWPNGEIPYEFKWGAYSKNVSDWLRTEFEFN